MEMMRTFRWLFHSLNELSVTGVINIGVKSRFGEYCIYRQYLSLHDTFAGNVRSSCPKAMLLALIVEQCRLSDAMQAPYHELGSLTFQKPRMSSHGDS